jgi:hypothetical protein
MIDFEIYIQSFPRLQPATTGKGDRKCAEGTPGFESARDNPDRAGVAPA